MQVHRVRLGIQGKSVLSVSTERFLRDLRPRKIVLNVRRVTLGKDFYYQAERDTNQSSYCEEKRNPGSMEKADSVLYWRIRSRWLVWVCRLDELMCRLAEVKYIGDGVKI